MRRLQKLLCMCRGSGFKDCDDRRLTDCNDDDDRLTLQVEHTEENLRCVIHTLAGPSI